MQESCDGENRKLYDVRIKKSDIPEELRQYYLNYDEVMTECECVEILKNDRSHVTYHNDDLIVLNISNTYDVYFNFTHMSEAWKIGNLKKDSPDELVRRILEEDTYALNLSKKISVQELVEKYGNSQSEKVFCLDDYKSYLLNCYLDDTIK